MCSYSRHVALKELRGDALNRKRNVLMTGSFERVPHKSNHDFSRVSHTYDLDLEKDSVDKSRGSHANNLDCLRGLHTKSHDLHANDSDFAKGASYTKV